MLKSNAIGNSTLTLPTEWCSLIITKMAYIFKKSDKVKTHEFSSAVPLPFIHSVFTAYVCLAKRYNSYSRVKINRYLNCCNGVLCCHKKFRRFFFHFVFGG